jgi:hypothetical protein
MTLFKKISAFTFNLLHIKYPVNVTEYKMISPRYAPIVFGLIVSGLMSCIVSGIATLRAFGFIDGFVMSWINAWWLSWAIAFPTIVTVSPFVRKMVARLTKTV